MRVCISGSRDLPSSFERDLQQKILETIAPETNPVIINGACPTGADKYANNLALRNNWVVESHAPDWGKYGRSAGPIRNREMAKSGLDLVIAFYYKKPTPGTANMVSEARKAKVQVVEFTLGN